MEGDGKKVLDQQEQEASKRRNDEQRVSEGNTSLLSLTCGWNCWLRAFCLLFSCRSLTPRQALSNSLLCPSRIVKQLTQNFFVPALSKH